MKTLSLLAVVSAITVLSSCNTTIGMGRDMRILGENMEKSANRAQGSGGGEETYGAPVY